MTEFKTFGEMLHHYRTQRKMTMRGLAERAGVSRSAVWNIEHNITQEGVVRRPRIPMVDALCDAVGADKASARLLVYPPDDNGSQVIVTGDGARLPDNSPGVNVRATREELLRQASCYREVAEKLERTAAELCEFID